VGAVEAESREITSEVAMTEETREITDARTITDSAARSAV